MLVSGDEVLRCFLMMRSSSLILDCLLILLVIPWSQGHSLFTCEPITIHQCEGLSYNMTFFPNKLEHYDQHIAAGAMEPFLPLMKLICSPDVRMFLCSAFVPACTEERQIVPPCRELCEKVLKDCEKLIETFGILWPEELQCDRLEYCNGGQHTSAIASTPRSVTEKTSQMVIQHDERNQEKLKKFMIRIGVFSGLYLVPLVALLGCYIYEQALRTTWETTWVHDYCQDYPIPCPNQVEALTRPDLSLFMMKYLMTLIVGIPAVFWVGSRKTCSEWANFFQSARKRDPITESRRVLQESCEFFLKHNSKVQHQKKHKSGFHKLRVISKSMGTCTTGGASHGTSLPAASPGTLSEAKHFLEINEHHALLPEMPSTLNVSTGERASISLLGQAMSADLTEKGSNEDINSVGPRVQSEGVQRVPDGRLTPSGNFAEESTLQSSYTLVPHYPCPTSSKGCASLVVHALPEFSKVEDPGNDDANA
ncbi:frizzled-6-like isoform X2 [Hypanus sabinus]|uniref:frizzled-6-like isoform X2 n=1 Tax=Hypanus sabinus TaxID=79690 RepID=UPI0028C47771|nr:frizzled-6-like isoform X2 [Hypanus sabinus]